MLSDNVLFLDVTELSRRIHAREITSVELTESYLDRSRRLGPELNAYVTLTPKLALEQARRADAELRAGRDRGPLHGIPYAAKDLLAVRGYPTTWGAKPYANQHFDFDATVIERLERAGAVLLGKAAMIELAGGMGYRFASASLTGAAKNPWNTDYWTCGSSSGSGAIVAGALAAFALGTETWGSIICPSTFCGVAGLRPTFGRVSRHGAMALCYSMDKIGPLARSARDLSTIFQALAGHDDADSGSLPSPEAAFHAASVAARLKRPLRVGWLSELWQKPEPGVAEAAAAAVKVLEAQGTHIDQTAFPDGPWDEIGNVTVAVEGASAFYSLIDSGRIAQLADPLGQVNGYAYLSVGAFDYHRAQRIRRILQQKIDALYDRYDVLVAASQPSVASPLDANLETTLTYSDPIGVIGNLCGLPAVSVPCGFTNAGLPIGFEFLGRVLGDTEVLAGATLYQQHTDWHKRRPPLGR
jgi:aspartyl-tRNA(Asn)/glutamyl-tRNA(Gln) amidotransferase subunit A